MDRDRDHQHQDEERIFAAAAVRRGEKKSFLNVAPKAMTANSIATAIASAVEQQGSATSEAATQTGTSSAEVLGAAGELATQFEALRAQVDGFVAKARAA